MKRKKTDVNIILTSFKVANKLLYIIFLILIITALLCSCRNFTNNLESNVGEKDTKNDIQEEIMGIEEKIYSLFNTPENRKENYQQIIHLLANIDWALYEEVSDNKSAELLEWLTTLEIEAKDDITPILNATKNLDGAYSEEYSVVVGGIYLRNKKNFIKALSILQPENQKAILDYVAYYCSYLEIDKIKIETSSLLKDNSFSTEEKGRINELLNSFETYK